MLRIPLIARLLTLLVSTFAGLFAQDRLIVIQAESGALGSDYVTATAGGATYITAGTDFAATGAPGIPEKVASYAITFPQAGTYHLYARVRVGPQGAADESYYYGNGFGVKAPADPNAWILVNNNPNVGYSAPGDVVLGGGTVGSGVFKWIRLSGFNFSEQGPTFVVPAGALTQIFQLGTRENGLDIDAIAFGLVGDNFTVANLLNTAPAIAAGQTLTAYEGAANGDAAGVVIASDVDAGDTLQAWTITGGSGASLFSINASTGQITVADAAALNANRAPSTYALTVTVSDGIFASAPQTVTVNVASLATIAIISQPDPGTYIAGETLSFQVGLNAQMTVNTAGGTPRIALTIGGATRHATYVAGSGTTRLTFTYTIQAGDEDADGIEVVSPVDLNGGEIKDGANNDVALAFAPPGTSTVRVDTTGPAAPVVIGYTNGSRAIAGTAEANSSVEVFLNGVSAGTTTATPFGDWSMAIDVSGYEAGSHPFTVTAIATDAVGNVGPASTGFPITVVIDPNAPLIVQAESGVLGADYATLPAGTVTYITAQTDLSTSPNTQSPGPAAKVATYTVTFPEAGTYDLYVRLRVGPGGASDDSFYYANGFGAKDSTNPNDWITVNNIAGIGFTTAGDWVTHAGSAWGGGGAANNVFKWVRLSFNNTDEPGIQFVVPAGARTQTFQIGTRENGLDIDQFAFARDGLFFTVANLNNATAGTTTQPPAPYTPNHPPLATGKVKFLGSAYSNSQAPNFAAYFNQVTPENSGKWGDAEPARDQMNWAALDEAYQLAQTNGFPFRFHVLIWGNQQPAWIESLPPAEQLEEIEEWFAAVAARYPNIDWLEVVNEPISDPPSSPGAGGGNYINALGGTGETGWDWVLNAFRLARIYFPDTLLMLNEYSIENDGNKMTRYLEIIELLQDENLIDVVGVQGHAFSLTGSTATLTSNLNRLGATGLPVQITELDIDGLDPIDQASEYMRVFPVFWEHPAVTGITLWGYRPGAWRTSTGSPIVYANGAEEESMIWLKDYIRNSNPPLQARITVQPEDAAVFTGETASFTVAATGNPAPAYQWQISADGGTTWTNLVDGTVFSGTMTDTLVVSGAGYALNGALFRAVATSGATPSATSEAAILTVNIVVTAHVRHAPTLNGTVEGSIQMLLPESMALNSSANVTGHVLVPGTPTIRINGQPVYGGTLEGPGVASPSNYTITLNSKAAVGHIVRRIDPIALPTVPTPPEPTGTKNVSLNGPNSPAVNFATLRNLTLNSNVGDVAVPAGTYGTFTANRNSGFTLGVAGATEPAVYNLEGLTLNSGAGVTIVGPVILNVRNTVTLNSSAVGAPAHPEWLLLSVSNGGVTLNSNSRLDGFIVAPAGTVTVNGGGTLQGGVESDRLSLNGGAVLKAAE